MVGASVHGLLGVDAELQRSALAAAAQERTADGHALRVTFKQRDRGDCPGGGYVPRTSQRS